MAKTFKINMIVKRYITFEVVAENQNQAVENLKRELSYDNIVGGDNITEVDTGYEDDRVMIEYYDDDWNLIHEN